jgi:hypothetical protein
MKIYLRPLAPGETDVEKLWCWVSVATLALGWVWLHWNLPLPECVVAKWAGLPCPTCGTTRAARAILAGHGWAAWCYNPLAVSSGVLGAFYLVYAAVVQAFRLRRVRFGKFSKKLGYVIRGTAILLLLANWVYLIYTLPTGGRGLKTWADFGGRSAVDSDVIHAKGG